MNRGWQMGLLACWLAALVAAVLLSLPGTRFSTSITDLLPREGLEVSILRELADTGQGHLVMAHLSHAEAEVSAAAVGAFLSSLRADDSISSASEAGADALGATAALLFEHRNELLLARWLEQNPDVQDAAQVAVRVVDLLEQFLDKPESLTLSELIPSDPFLLMADTMDQMSGANLSGGRRGSTLWIEQLAPPFSEDGQEPVFDAMQRAHAAALEQQPGLQLQYTSLGRFAHASKQAIKGEITRLNLLCLAFVLLMLVVVVRTWRPVLLISLTVAMAMATATAVVFVLFSEVHILSLVIGSILAGIAVDYGLHLVLEERHGMQRQAVTRVVLSGSISSAAGFLTLLWSVLPFLQQLGVFVGSGLVAALVAALLLRPKSGMPPAPAILRAEPFRLPKWTGPVLICAMLPGLFYLQWGDRISALEYPLPQLYGEDAKVRELSGGESLQPYVVHAEDPVTARDLLDTHVALTAATGSVHAGDWIPTLSQMRATQRFLQSLETVDSALKEALEDRGYVADAFAPFFTDFQNYLESDLAESTYRDLLASVAASLPGPLANLVHVSESMSWFMVLLPPQAEDPSGEGIYRLDQESILDGAFARYRHSMSEQMGICFAVLVLVVLFLIGVKRGAGAVALTTVAVAAAFGLSGYLQIELGLFHLVGALLAFCIALDYAIFAVESRHHDNRLPASVAVSALSTAGVFAILASSPIPAVQSLGLTVLAVISFSILLLMCGWPGVSRLPVLDRSLFWRLPHGDTALLISGMRKQDGTSIEAYLDRSRALVIPPEALVEAMAQAAALMIACVTDKSEKQRMGMLVMVQDAKLPPNGLRPQLWDYVAVQCLSPIQPGMLRFRGQLHCQQPDAECTVEFSIFIPETDVRIS